MEQDERFKHVLTDPKFRRIPKRDQKVKIDKRFQSMFEGKQFKVNYTVDKRGRPVSHKSSEDLKRYYHLSSESESDSGNEEDETAVGKFVRPPKSDEDSDSQLNVADKTDKKLPEEIKVKLKNLEVDYARGESTLFSESSSDDESEAELSETDSIDHGWGELDRDADRTDEITHRLAACNMDWDRIRAADLMVLLSSFLPPGGLIRSVTIYPSEFGLQRMKEEEINGPSELVNSKCEDENVEENEDGAKYHMEKLRKYQLNRLKYYYAVIICDSSETANKLYSECDGLEYESSATRMDLRFIPDDTEFDHEPKEVCDELPEAGKYQPRFFTTSALQQAKVDLTWDETNPERIEVTKKLASGNVDDVTNEVLQAYLASSSEEEQSEVDEEKSDDEDDPNPIDKYRSLLQDIENDENKKKHRDVEMEITWGINLKSDAEKSVKKKINENENKTPFQQFLDKRKEKRKEKKKERKQKTDSDIPSDVDMNDPYFAEEFDKSEFKQAKTKKRESPEKNEQQAELELLLMNEDDGNRSHFNLKEIQDGENESKSKRKRNKRQEVKKEDNFQVDVKDDRFSALYSSHHFNIDPTDPHYKKTKAMEALANEKLKRRVESDASVDGKKAKIDGGKRDAELSVLVKSVKCKTEAMKRKKLS